MHASPAPAYPSYRLMCVLQLYHLARKDGLSTTTLPLWRNVVQGRAALISEENEAEWRGSVAHICNVLECRSRDKLAKLHDVDTSQTQWFPYALESVRQLWVEEQHVAAAVKCSIENNVMF
jgi:hypothetical protein